jgi:hypothetical protein
VSRGSLILHLSWHHGDGSPGACIRVIMRGVEAFHREINAKGYRYMRPELEKMPRGMLEKAIDRFGNLIRFCEPTGQPSGRWGHQQREASARSDRMGVIRA